MDSITKGGTEVNLMWEKEKLLATLESISRWAWCEYSCNYLNVCVPSKLVCWNPTFQDDGVGRWALWEVIRSWWLCPLEWDLSLIKGTQKSPLAPSYVKTRQEGTVSKPGSRTLSDTKSAGTLLLNLQSSELWEIHFCSLATQCMGFCYSSPYRQHFIPLTWVQDVKTVSYIPEFCSTLQMWSQTLWFMSDRWYTRSLGFSKHLYLG